MILVIKPASYFFFFNDTATTEIYTLSLHDALPIYDFHAAALAAGGRCNGEPGLRPHYTRRLLRGLRARPRRSEEHTSELQSPCNLVCRPLLEKKKHSDLIIECANSMPCPPQRLLGD